MREITRSLESEIIELALGNSKMAFISGPRQVGKTYLTKKIADKNYSTSIYYNWDEIIFRKTWQQNPRSLLKSQCIIFDEIHKGKKWKTTLKGIFDHNDTQIPILVTGSAKLEVFRRGGDSLMGRYFHFCLHPLSIGELINKSTPSPDDSLLLIKEIAKKTSVKMTSTLTRLFVNGGFPEPFLKNNLRFLNLWQKGRIEKLVRIDLRDISQIRELGQVEVLCSIIPSKIGSTLSLRSIAEDMEVSSVTIKNWLSYLSALYYIFEIKPFSKNIPRSLKKEGKIYLWDYSMVDDKGARMENLVASHLLKAVQYWSFLGYGNFDLKYLRDKEKREVDFVIIKDNKPWALFEVKLKKDQYAVQMDYFRKFHPEIKLCVTLTGTENIYRDLGEGRYVVSIANFLTCFP